MEKVLMIFFVIVSLGMAVCAGADPVTMMFLIIGLGLPAVCYLGSLTAEGK